MIDVAFRHRFAGFELDVAFRIARPGITALFGPSGSGKTTAINVIAGLLRPEHGRVDVNGETFLDSERAIAVPARRRKIGYVFQDARLFPHLSVRANLLFGARRSRERLAPGEFDGIVALLGLAPLLGRTPASLSGGERQRVALGRALLSKPKLLLLDEPLAALDQARRNEILPHLERLRDETRLPILYVSHAVDEVARLADTVIVLNAGCVAAQGSVFDIMTRLDLFPLTGRFEAGGVIDGRIARHDETDSLSEISFDSGTLMVPHIPRAVGDRLRVRIRARDIVLALSAPAGLSANNVLAAQIAGIREDPGAYADVKLACGATMLIARITRRSLRRMALVPGMAVFALVKSVTVDGASLSPSAGHCAEDGADYLDL